MPATFRVSDVVMNRLKEARMNYFEQQLGEIQLNIAILTRSIEVFNDPQDVAALALEQVKYQKIVLNYDTVEDYVQPTEEE